jgi:hypothetical protein
MSKLATMIEQFNAMKEALERDSKELLGEHFKEEFAGDTELKGLRWTQYTPSFNDGDPCTFRVGDLNARYADTDEDAGDKGDGYDYVRYDSPLRKRFETIPDEFMLAAFGDGSEITVTRGDDGLTIEVGEYDCGY